MNVLQVAILIGLVLGLVFLIAGAWVHSRSYWFCCMECGRFFNLSGEETNDLSECHGVVTGTGFCKRCVEVFKNEHSHEKTT